MINGQEATPFDPANNERQLVIAVLNRWIFDYALFFLIKHHDTYTWEADKNTYLDAKRWRHRAEEEQQSIKWYCDLIDFPYRFIEQLVNEMERKKLDKDYLMGIIGIMKSYEKR